MKAIEFIKNKELELSIESHRDILDELGYICEDGNTFLSSDHGMRFQVKTDSNNDLQTILKQIIDFERKVCYMAGMDGAKRAIIQAVDVSGEESFERYKETFGLELPF